MSGSGYDSKLRYDRAMDDSETQIDRPTDYYRFNGLQKQLILVNTCKSSTVLTVIIISFQILVVFLIPPLA